MCLMWVALVSSCVTVNPYQCPTTTEERYRKMDHRDTKNLNRKPNSFKRRSPKGQSGEGMGEDFDYVQ